jgi:hypothetical protein
VRWSLSFRFPATLARLSLSFSRVLQLAAMVSMIAFHASFRIRSGAEYLNASVVHIGLGAYYTHMVFN